MVLIGKERPYHFEKKPGNFDFYDLKGILEALFQHLRIKESVFSPSEEGFFHPGRQASVSVGDLRLGVLGEIHPKIMRRIDVKGRLYYAEFDLQDLISVQDREEGVQDLPQFPGSERDLTVTVSEGTSFDMLLRWIEECCQTFSFESLLKRVELIDVYRSDAIGEGQKNVTLRFYYRDDEKTLEQDVVEAQHTKIVTYVESRR